MSDNPEGFVVYGYELGGGSSEVPWKLKNLIEGRLYTPWYSDGDDNTDFADTALKMLARDRYDDYDDEHYWRFTDLLPMRIILCGSWDYHSYILGVQASLQRVEWADVKPIVTNYACGLAEDTNLKWALDTLGLSPVQPEPTWLLGCFYG